MGAEKIISRLHPEKSWFLVIGRGFDSRHLHPSDPRERMFRLAGSSPSLTRGAIFVSIASIRERVRADGTRSFAVLWRDPETKRQSSLTYDENDARVAKHLLEATGGHTNEAARIADAFESTARPSSRPCRSTSTS